MCGVRKEVGTASDHNNSWKAGNMNDGRWREGSSLLGKGYPKFSLSLSHQH